MRPILSTAEVAAFTGLEERRVRKDLEYGIFGASAPPRFEMPAVIYFRALAELGFDLKVEDRKKLYLRIRQALEAETESPNLALSSVIFLRFGDLVSSMKGKLRRFEMWKKRRLTEDERILGGEPVFAETRLAVRRVGGLLLNGASAQEIKDDYPYLEDSDIEFARLYALAYPRVGRPRETPAR